MKIKTNQGQTVTNQGQTETKQGPRSISHCCRLRYGLDISSARDSPELSASIESEGDDWEDQSNMLPNSRENDLDPSLNTIPNVIKWRCQQFGLEYVYTMMVNPPPVAFQLSKKLTKWYSQKSAYQREFGNIFIDVSKVIIDSSFDSWKAAIMNIQILMEDMDVWNDMDDTPDVNMIDSNWIFNLKRFHDRMVEKSRECFDALHDGMVKKFKGFFIHVVIGNLKALPFGNFCSHGAVIC